MKAPLFLPTLLLLLTPARAENAPVPAVTKVDLSGEWRLLLPAGFEHQVKLTAVGNDQYRISGPANFAFAAVYGWQGDQLRWIGKTVPEDANIPALMEQADGYIWKVHGPYMLTLTYDHHRNGGDYLGAVLFRAKPAGQPKKNRPDQVPLLR